MKTFFYMIASFLIMMAFNANAQCDYSDELPFNGITASSDGFEFYSGYVPNTSYWSVYPATGSYSPVPATIVTNERYCGSKSANFKASPSPTDMLYKLEASRTTFKIKIPYGKSAKMSFLTSSNGVVFSMIFGTDGMCRFYLNDGNTSSPPAKTVSYTQGSWLRISNVIGDNESYVFFENDNVAKVTSPNVSNITKLNLFANTYIGNGFPYQQNDDYYIDYLLNAMVGCCVTCSPVHNPVCLNQSNTEISSNECYAWSAGWLYKEFHECNSSNGSACEGATPINCGQTISGTTVGETFKFYRPDYGSCLIQGSNDFRAPDKVYKFTKTDNSGDIGITLVSKRRGVDLDVFLVDDCGKAWSGNPQIVINVPPGEPNNPNIRCIASGNTYVDGGDNGYDTDYIEYKNLPAGEYYIIIDGQHWENTGYLDDVGEFDLTLTCKDLDCSQNTPIQCNETKYNQTMNGANNVSVYCSPTPYGSGSTNPLPPGAGNTGNERVYNFTPNTSGFVTITVSGFGTNQDLELYLLQNCDHTSCLAKSTNPSGQTETITYNVISGRTYQIVVDGFLGSNSTFNISVSCCSGTPQYINCSSGGTITHYYNGDGNNLRYTFSTSEQLASGYQWVVRQNGNVVLNNGGNDSGVIVTFNNPGNYEICYPRLNSQGCVEYCCYPVTVDNPFNCNAINYSYNAFNNTFTFTAQSNGSNGQWLADNGSNAPSVIPGGTLPVPGTCVMRTISYRYFDGVNWRYCCRNIWICNPFTCGNDGNITYSFTQDNKFQFALNNANQYSNISWTIDTAIPLNIGFGSTATWYPGAGADCRTYPVSVRYWDQSCNCWRICCRSIYVCNPFNCGNISIGYQPSSNKFTFGLGGTNPQFNNFNWTLDDYNTNIGNAANISYIPPSHLNCGRYTYSVRYWDGTTWRICCIPLYVCDPSYCGDDIYYTFNNGNLSLSTKPSYNVINWYIDDNPTGSSTFVNQGTYTISLLYYDNNLKQYRVCKKSVFLTSNENTVINKSKIYPNPTNNKVVIESPYQIKSIKLTDINGRRIEAKQENNTIDLSKLANSMYIVQVETDSGLEYHKVIKAE